jgi:hypothetical protein
MVVAQSGVSPGNPKLVEQCKQTVHVHAVEIDIVHSPDKTLDKLDKFPLWQNEGFPILRTEI